MAVGMIINTSHHQVLAAAARPGSFSKAKTHRDQLRQLRALAPALLALPNNSKEVALVANELATSVILETSRPDIHLQSATCFVELFRLSAPESAWSGETLRAVMRLLIKELELIGQTLSPATMSSQFHILESISVVKIPIVLLQDEQDSDANLQLLNQLFTTCIQIASRSLPQPFENCIRDILSCVIEEADPIPRSLIMILLTSLLGVSSGGQRGRELAKRVIRECKGMLESSITDIISSLTSSQSSSTLKEFGSRSRQSELIYELACVDASMLRGAFSHLQDALESTHEERRLQFVKLFGRIFSNEDCRVVAEFSLLLNAYLKRVTDVCDRVREEFIVMAPAILATVPVVRVQLTSVLIERSLDLSDKVRLTLVRSVCEAALAQPNVIDTSLLDAVGGRLLDKKPLVRIEAVNGLAALFKAHCSRFWGQCKPVPSHMMKFNWIPHKIIALYLLTFPDRGQSIELVMDQHIVDKSLAAAPRTFLLLGTFATCDDKQQKVFVKRYIGNKRHAALIISDLIMLREQIRAARDANQIKRLTMKRDQRLQSLMAFLPTSVDCKLLQGLFEHRDGNVFKWLRLCIDSTRETLEIRAAMNELHGALTTSKKLQTVADSVAVAISMVTLGKDNVPHLFDIVAHNENKKLVAGAMLILTAIAESAPQLFTSHLEPIADAVKLTSTSLSTFSLRIMALCSSSKVSTDIDPQILERFCLEGVAAEADWAATIVCNTDVALASSILLSAASHMESSSPHLCAALTSIATIARLQPQIAHDSPVIDKVVAFVLDDLLTDLSEPAAQCIGLRFLTDYVVGLEIDVNTRHGDDCNRLREAVLGHLWSLLMKPETTSETLLLSASSLLIKLLTIPHIEGSMGPKEFAALANLLVSTSSLSVRSSVIDDLWKHLMVLKLPFRYAALFPFVFSSEHADFRKLCRKKLLTVVERTRQASTMIVQCNQTGAKPVPFSRMPEYAIPFLLHALASQPAFDSTASSLRASSKYISSFLDALLTSHNHNFAFIIALLHCVKSSIPLSGSDRVIPPDNLYGLADLTLLLLKQKYQHQEWSSLDERRSSKLSLPSVWFRLLPGPVGRSYLPPGFLLKGGNTVGPPSTASATPMKGRTTPKRLKSLSTTTTPLSASRPSLPRRVKSKRSLSSVVTSSGEENVLSDEDDGREVYEAQAGAETNIPRSDDDRHDAGHVSGRCDQDEDRDDCDEGRDDRDDDDRDDVEEDTDDADKALDSGDKEPSQATPHIAGEEETRLTARSTDHRTSDDVVLPAQYQVASCDGSSIRKETSSSQLGSSLRLFSESCTPDGSGTSPMTTDDRIDSTPEDVPQPAPGTADKPPSTPPRDVLSIRQSSRGRRTGDSSQVGSPGSSLHLFSSEVLEPDQPGTSPMTTDAPIDSTPEVIQLSSDDESRSTDPSRRRRRATPVLPARKRKAPKRNTESAMVSRNPPPDRHSPTQTDSTSVGDIDVLTDDDENHPPRRVPSKGNNVPAKEQNTPMAKVMQNTFRMTRSRRRL